jgi:lipopolysaccharide heptosyltransferase I
VRILIVKLGSIGDIVHTLPALGAIRRGLPYAKISWVVEARCAEILKDNPMIDNLIEVDTHRLRRRRDIDKIVVEAGRQFRGLRKFEFDIALDFQGLLKSATIAKLSGAKRRWGFSRAGLREPASRLLLTNAVKTPKQVHIIRKNLALVAGALKIAVPDKDLDFPISTSHENVAEAEALIENCENGDFALLNPGGGWETKLWHAEKFGQLADRLREEKGLSSIVSTGPNESELASMVAAGSRSGKLIFAQPSLKGFYELAKRARVYVGGDTGPTHIAVAAGAPVVGLFGPTEWWRNGSPNPGDICVERNDIDCRVDCHRRTCSKWICMDSDVDAVFAAVNERLLKVTSGERQVIT